MTSREQGSSAKISIEALPTGTQIGPYRIERLLNSGGMGCVYSATHDKLQRIVAIKFMLEDRVESDVDVKRFIREAKAAASLSHQNLVSIYDAGTYRGNLYMVQEFIDGGDLRDYVLKRSKLDEAEALSLLHGVASGLGEFERAGLIHRDIKPSNIFLTSRGIPKLGDLGLAKDIGSDEQLTMVGACVGTPAYMSPEQIQSEADIDIRTDIYSLGVSLFVMLTGRAPYEAADRLDVLKQVLRSSVPDLKQYCPDTSEGICALVDKMMAKDPRHRFARVRDLLSAIEQLQSGKPLRHKPRTKRVAQRKRKKTSAKKLLVPVLIALLAIMLLLVLWQMNQRPSATPIIEVQELRPFVALPEPVSEQPAPDPEVVVEPEPVIITQQVLEPAPESRMVLQAEPAPIVAVSKEVLPIIIDDADPGVEYRGNWIAGEMKTGHKVGYRYNTTRHKTGLFASFPITVEQSGIYRVSVWYTAHKNRSDATEHSIVHKNGTTKIIVNQRINGEQWWSLGEFDFDIGKDYSCSILSGGESRGFEVVDGLRLDYIGTVIEK